MKTAQIQVSALLVLLASFAIYRRGARISERFPNRFDSFPLGYFAGGDYNSDCTTLGKHVEGPDADKMRFCEDATLWDVLDAQGKVVDRPLIASCDSGRRQWNTVMGPLQNPEPHGTLWLYVPRSDARIHPRTDSSSFIPDDHRGKPLRITLIDYPPNHDFHPLGVAIWPSYGGNSSNLYVVNHARQRSVIEQFVLDPHDPTRAIHVRTITSSTFVAPNALALTSPDAFYVTNDHLMTRRIPLIGDFLSVNEWKYSLPLGSLLHVTLNTIKPTSPPTPKHASISDISISKLFIPFANGVALSPSGKDIAVASSALGEVFIYDRDPSTNILKRRQKIAVPFRPDNLHYEASSDGGEATLIIAGHPDLVGLVHAAADAPGPSAKSWVIAAAPGDQGDITTIFKSNGIESAGGFGSSTTGLVDPETGTVYIPGLYAREGVMMCRSKAVITNTDL